MLNNLNKYLLKGVLAITLCLGISPVVSEAVVVLPGIRQTIGNGIGFNHSYTTAEMLLVLENMEGFSPFLDVRGHHFTNERFAGNIGVGLRYNACEALFGGNIYYDYLQSHGEDFNQIGGGIEMLGCDYSLRLNGYFPVGKKYAPTRHCIFDHYLDGYIMLKNQFITVLKGADAEFEMTLISCPSLQVYGAVGPYYLRTSFCTKNIFGGQFRLSANLYRYFNAGILVTSDSTFGTRTSGQIGFTIPFGLDSCECLEGISNQILPVRRHEIIANKKQCQWQTNF